MRTIVELMAVGAVYCVAMAPVWAADDDGKSGAFVFTSFRGNGEDGLHLAWSEDGYTWRPLKGDRSFLRPTLGPHKLMRDPCIVAGPGGTFHMVWTTGWGDRIIGYASSKDLIEWSAQKDIPAMMHEPKARNAWAPELFYDDKKCEFLIFWASTIPGRFAETEAGADKGWNHRMYYTATKDFQTFEPTKLFFDGGFNVIDATILKAEDGYRLIVKDETLKPVAKHLRMARGDSPRGPWGPAGPAFTIDWVEGPSAIRIGSEYFVYFDHYARPHYYGAVKSADLKTWQDVSRRMEFPRDHRHGTVLRVSRSALDRLKAAR
ncbi:MAG: Glycosyl hydrolases family 43 [Planctomycetes bacterium ADurb.Bin126]|nr:MAG: Glycosyl hydrolases family 43 [Planctomycetes bacterium ADurb.Bin126]